jgi:sugar (pentulose or hexulose) kinase
VLGPVSADAAALTGIPAGTPVVAGATDGCAAQLGSGALETGSWNSVLGTTLVLKGVSKDLVHDPLGVVYSHKAPNGNWLPGGASSTGAGILSREFPGRDLNSLETAARQFEPAGLTAYPLASRGERFPFQAPQADGFTLSTPTSDGQHYAALLQGIAFIERLSFDYLDLLGAPVDGPLVLTGGGTNSHYWCQLRADVLGRPVTLPENAEPALGMALLAASHGRDTTAVAAEMVTIRQVLDPRGRPSEIFTEPYLALVTELETRGWLPSHVANHAKERAAR